MTNVAGIVAYARAKHRPVPPRVEAVRPTPERIARAGCVHEEQATDDAGRKLTHLKRVRIETRVEGMARSKWFEYRSPMAEALERYAKLAEDCGYGNTKSCLDVRVPSHDDGRGSDRLAERKSTLAYVRNALCGHPDAITGALFVVDAMLWPADIHETLTDTAMRVMRLGERLAMERAKPFVLHVAGLLTPLMGVA